MSHHPPSAAFLAQFSFNPAQDAFVRCAARFSFYVGGVGAGKTLAGAVRSLARALDQPGSLGLIGAPTYPMLRDSTQRTLFELLEGLGEGARGSELPGHGADGLKSVETAPPGSDFSRRRRTPALKSRESKGQDTLPYTYNKSEGHLSLANGSEILLRSLDEPDRVRGLNLAWFWLDEAPLCGYYAWQILKGRLRQSGYETAGWATGTPHGRDGYARDFEIERKAHHALFRASTHDNAAHLPEDYIADLGYTGALYDQEVLGLFAAFEGLVYTFQADSEGHVRERGGALGSQEPEYGDGEGLKSPQAGRDGTSVPKKPCAGTSVPRSAASWRSVIGGVDWGYTNPTAAVVFGLDGDGRAHQLDEWYQRRAPLDAVVLPALCDLTRRHGVSVWHCGPDEPEHIAALQAALQAALIREGLPCRALPANDAVRPGIQTVTRLLARREDGTFGLTVAPRCMHTIAEYQSYQYETPASGSIGRARGEVKAVSELPMKQNDHALDATRYALHTALGQPMTTRSYLATYLTPGSSSRQPLQGPVVIPEQR
jgi:hypothetical protein